MWIWSVFVALCMANVMVCIYESSDYEAPWEALGYRLAMDPTAIQLPMYRSRNPRQVYYYEPNNEDPSLVAQDRIARSHSFIEPHNEPSKRDPSVVSQDRIARSHSLIEPHYEPSYGDQSLVAQDRIARSHSINDPHYESSKWDSSLVAQDRIARSHSFIEPHYEPSKGDPSLVDQERIARSHSFIEPNLLHYGEESELPPVFETDLQGIRSRMEKRRELRNLARDVVEVQILDMDPLQLKEALILGLRSLAERQEKQFSAVSELYHDGVVPAELDELSNDNHKNKLNISSKIYKDPSDTELKTGASNKNNEEYTGEIQEMPKNNVYKGKSVQQASKSKKWGVEDGKSKDVYENPIQSNVNYDDYMLTENNVEEYTKDNRLDLTRNVRSRNYHEYLDEPLHSESETVPKGRNLEVSNFINPEKNTINSIAFQNNKKINKYFSTNNKNNGLNNYFEILNNTNQHYQLKDQSFVDNTPILLPSIEEIPIMEAVTEDSMVKNEVFESDDSSMQDTSEKSNESTEFTSDSFTEVKNSKNSKEDENQKDKEEYFKESKDLGIEIKNKENNITKTSNESSSESLEDDFNSDAEGINPVTLKYIPSCPESMDPSFRVDEHKGIICSSDDDCEGDEEYCCQAYTNLNKCWFK